MWEWIDDRWHLDGKPVHAGDGVEVRWPDGTWQRVRVESADAGRRLYAHFDYHGLGLSVRVHTDSSELELRWPGTKVEALKRTADVFTAAAARQKVSG